MDASKHTVQTRTHGLRKVTHRCFASAEGLDKTPAYIPVLLSFQIFQSRGGGQRRIARQIPNFPPSTNVTASNVHCCLVISFFELFFFDYFLKFLLSSGPFPFVCNLAHWTCFAERDGERPSTGLDGQNHQSEGSDDQVLSEYDFCFLT